MSSFRDNYFNKILRDSRDGIFHDQNKLAEIRKDMGVYHNVKLPGWIREELKVRRQIFAKRKRG